MCGRYDNLIARDAYKALYRAGRLPASNFPLRYNIAPTDQIPIVRIDTRDGEREVIMARWGLIPFWMKEKPRVPHINARAETIYKLPLFREAFAKRRCLIPATGFYEWQQRADGKQPYRFVRKDLEPFAFTAIWEFARIGGEDIVSARMIVGEANPLVTGVHARMPVMLLSQDYDRWLDPTAGIEEVRGLLRPYDPALMKAYAVNRVVNRSRTTMRNASSRSESHRSVSPRSLGCHGSSREIDFYGRRLDASVAIYWVTAGEELKELNTRQAAAER